VELLAVLLELAEEMGETQHSEHLLLLQVVVVVALAEMLEHQPLMV
jgi:hypothetical protein